MRSWLGYAAWGLAVVVAGAGLLMLVVSPAQRRAVMFGAGLSYVLQLGAFAALLRFRDDAQLFLLGWAAGIGLRFLAVGVVAYVLTQTTVLPAEPALLSLVGFLVVLLFMEPLFLRRGQTGR